MLLFLFYLNVRNLYALAEKSAKIYKNGKIDYEKVGVNSPEQCRWISRMDRRRNRNWTEQYYFLI